MKIATFVLIVSIAKTATSSLIVELPKLGKIKGRSSTSLNERSFHSFEGLPYAQPPVGKYRFEKPVPPTPWEGVWVAKSIYKCMQYDQYTAEEDRVIGDEDCLYLNIYTPTLDKDANLNVIVFIHGGAFMFGHGGFYGPLYIMDKDVVYVTFNYRLGPLGFLSTEDEELPGNNGIKDQILALQWIKEHIRHFGGNNNSITLTGMSAGGAGVHLHYLIPKSKGLFNRGISQSGTALNPWVLMENALQKTKQLAENVGCPKNKTEELVNCLKARPARQIVASVKQFQPWLYIPFSPFGVVVDSWSSDPVLLDHPYNLMKHKQVSDLPWIASHTDAEGLYPAAEFFTEEYLNDIDTRWNELLPLILDYNYTVDPKLKDGVSQKIRERYLKTKTVDADSFQDFVRILSDRLFAFGVEKAVKLQSAAMKSSVYFYYFTYRGTKRWLQGYIEDVEDFGSAHAEDTAYVLKTGINTTSTADDRSMVDLFVNLFTSFAEDGVPKIFQPWGPVSKNVKAPLNCLQIESHEIIRMGMMSMDDAQFWESLSIKENEKFVTTAAKDEL